MSNQSSLSVTVIGIPPQEEGVLKRIFGLTSSRTRSYVLAPLTPNHTPDIFLVDNDDQDAVTQWRTLCSAGTAHATVPTVLVSKTGGKPAPPLYHLQRPLLAPRVLGVLDQVVPKGPAAPAVVTQHHKALVVDDSATVRKQVELELERLGIDADVAEDGEQALTHLKSHVPYDIIFLDVVLPDMDGYSICKTIKKDKHRRQTPVVMLTGKGSPFDRVRGKLAGCDLYLTKPVSRESFQTTVKQYLSDLPKEEITIG
jgi:twitching motility two-component system response regulator PilG